MSTQERIRMLLDLISTTALVAAAAVLVWATIERRPNAAVAAAPGNVPSGAAYDSVDLTTDLAGHSMGSQSAQLVVIEFSDFQCPFCERFARDTLPQLKRDYVDTGKVRFVYRHNPLESIHPLARAAALATDCAHRQQKGWQMHDHIFAGQRQLTQSSFIGFATSLSLDAQKFAACLEEEPDSVKRDQAEALRLGIESTPIVLIGRVEEGGKVRISRRINGASPYDVFKEVLKTML